MQSSIDITMPEYKRISLNTKAETAREVLPKIIQKEANNTKYDAKIAHSNTTSQRLEDANNSLLNQQKKSQIKMGNSIIK